MSTGITSSLGALGTGVQSLGLALIIGGLLALGAFTAPVLFKAFSRPEAGEAMMIIFKRYDIVLLVAVVLVAVGEVLRILPAGVPSMSFFAITRYGLLLALMGMTLYSTLSLTPTMMDLYQNPDYRAGNEQGVVLHEQFNRSHKFSERLAKMQLVLGLILMLMTPFAQPEELQ